LCWRFLCLPLINSILLLYLASLTFRPCIFWVFSPYPAS
jgi:hypothetical protein